jgi:uncharacterized membrane protein YraQ (UPF0718 family)/copper chaperone CopZ
MDAVLTFLTEFVQALWLVTAQMAPWLLLGFLVAGLLSVYVSARWLERHLGGGGFGPVLKAAVFGVPLPLCSCGVIPVAASLRRHGASPAATTSFLISTPQTGVDSIAVTGALMGPFFAVFRPVAALLTGVLGGGVVQATQTRAELTAPADTGTAPDLRGGRLRAALAYGFETLPRDIGNALAIGLVLAALISTLVPAGSLAGQFGGGILPVLVMIVVGIPLYVCATGSVPLAAGFIHAGVSPGAALAFLIAGPATNAATVTTLLKVLGRRTTAIYLATVGLSALGGGLLLDALAGGFDLQVPMLHTGHDHETIGWAGHLWAALLVLVMTWAYRPWRRGAAAAACGCDDGVCATDATEATTMETVELKVGGMNCSHCTASVERALGEQPGVREVEVSLAEGRARVSGDGLDAGALAAIVSALGYNATPA